MKNLEEFKTVAERLKEMFPHISDRSALQMAINVDMMNELDAKMQAIDPPTFSDGTPVEYPPVHRFKK